MLNLMDFVWPQFYGAPSCNIGTDAFADEARSRGFDHVTVVWASGDEGPEEFFKAVGFEIIGETPYGEKLGALKL